MGLVRTASVWAPIVALSLTSCGTVTNGTAVSATSATSTEEAASTTSAPAIPHQPASKNNDGTTFDPCVAYGTDDLRAVGLDPASGKDIDSALLRGCKWYGAGWRVQVAVLNGSIERYRDQKLFPGSQPIIVDGLSGVTYRDEPGNMRNCFVEIPSQQATVGTIVEVSDAPALDQIPDACTKAVEVATLTAKKLPK